MFKIDHVFVVNEFSLLPQKQGESITSPVFYNRSNKEIEWALLVYPKGFNSDSKDHLSLFVKLNSAEETVFAMFTLSILTSNNKILAECCTRIAIDFQEREGRGLSKLLKLEVLNQNSTYLDDDELRFKCEIKYVSYHGQLNSLTIQHQQLAQAVLNFNFSEPMCSAAHSDIVVEVKGKQFKAHRAILASRSSVICNMIQALNRNDTHSNVLKFEDMEPEIFAEISRFIYTDEVKNLEELAPKILPIAEQYKLNLLKIRCEFSIARNVRIENCCQLLLLADRYSAMELKKIVLDFIRSNAADVIKTPNWKEFVTSNHQSFFASIDEILMVITTP